MPCMDYGTVDSSDHDFLKERCDFLARIACKALTRLESLDSLIEKTLNPDEIAWWKQHQIDDAKQKEEEKQEKAYRKSKKKALSKLTQEERALLGL